MEDIKAMIMTGKTYREISAELKQQCPQMKGFSARSVKRYVSQNNPLCKKYYVESAHVQLCWPYT